MPGEELSPDGCWLFTQRGWLSTSLDLQITPDGKYRFSNGVYTETDNERAEVVDSFVAMNDAFPTGGVNDSVVMGDLNYQVINQSMTPESIANLIKQIFSQMGVQSPGQNPTLYDQNQIALLRKSIAEYDNVTKFDSNFSNEPLFWVADAARISGDWDDAIIRFNRIINSGSMDNFRRDSMRILSMIHLSRNDLEESEKYILMCMQEAKNSNDSNNYAKGMNELARILGKSGKMAPSRKMFQQAIDYSIEHDIASVKMLATYNLGLSYLNSGDLINSKDLLNKSLGYARVFGAKILEKQINRQLAKIFRYEGDDVRANDFDRISRNMALRSENDKDKAYDFYSNGENYFRRSLFKEALEQFLQAKEIFEKLQMVKIYAETCSYVGECYEKQNQYDLAVENYSKSCKYSLKVNDGITFAQSAMYLSALYFDKKEYIESIKWGKKGYEKATEIQDNSLRYELSKWLILSYIRAGNKQEARLHYEICKRLATKLSNVGSNELESLRKEFEKAFGSIY